MTSLVIGFLILFRLAERNSNKRRWLALGPESNACCKRPKEFLEWDGRLFFDDASVTHIHVFVHLTHLKNKLLVRTRQVKLYIPLNSFLHRDKQVYSFHGGIMPVSLSRDELRWQKISHTNGLKWKIARWMILRKAVLTRVLDTVQCRYILLWGHILRQADV